MAVRSEETRAATGIVAATGIARRRVPRCHNAAIPVVTLAATDEDHLLVRNWICTSRSCAVRPTVEGTEAIAARQVTVDLGLVMAEAAVHRAMAAVAAHPAMVEAAMPRAAAEGTTAAVVTRAAEVGTRVAVEDIPAVVVIANRRMVTS